MPVIVISAKPGSGSSTVGRTLAERLKIDFFSAGDYFKSHGSGKSTEKALGFWKTEKANTKEFHEELENIYIEKAKKGNIVIDAKLGIHFLKDIADLTVWLNASFEKRAERYAKKDDIPLEEATVKLKEKETVEEEKYMKIYGFNLNYQEKEAKLIIDTTDKLPEEIVEEIMKNI
jgi:CMP/dCMP kinase